METTIGFRVQGWNEGMEKNTETTTLGYVGTMRIHSFIPS